MSKSKKIVKPDTDGVGTSVQLGKVIKAVEALDGIVLVFDESGAPVISQQTGQPKQRPLSMSLLFAVRGVARALQSHTETFQEAYKSLVERANEHLAQVRAEVGLAEGQEPNEEQQQAIGKATQAAADGVNTEIRELELSEVIVVIPQKIKTEQLERNNVKLSYDQLLALEGWILE